MKVVPTLPVECNPGRFYIRDMEGDLIWLAFPGFIEHKNLMNADSDLELIASVVHEISTPDHLFFDEENPIEAYPIGAVNKLSHMLTLHAKREQVNQGLNVE